MKSPNHEASRLELENVLRDHFGDGLRISAFATQSAKPVFRADLPDGRAMFVKAAKTAKAEVLRKTLDEIDLPFVTRITHLIPYVDGRCIICQDWQNGHHIAPEDMTPQQRDSLIAAAIQLQNSLRPSHIIHPPRDIEAAYSTISDFVRRHPLAKPFLRRLLDIPKEERTYPPGSLVPIHGDLHYHNYLFDGDGISAIMDFEAVTTGLRTQDFAYLVLRRFFKERLAEGKQAALIDCLAKMFRATGASRNECIVALNMWRLIFAARRLAAHPASGPVALLVWKRDRPLRRVLERIMNYEL